MRREVRCPVCGRPGGPPGAAGCVECGWPLNTRPRAGVVTQDMQRDFDARLRNAKKARAGRDERALRAALRDAVAAVRQDREAAVIEVGLAGIDMVIVSLDAMETPTVRDAWHLDWASVVPKLPADKNRREAQLTDGVPHHGDEAVAAAVRDRLPPLASARVLVACRPAGGRVLEAVAAAIAGAARSPASLLRVAGADGPPARQLAAEAAACDPLRRPYYLLTARVNAVTGEVRPAPVRLFAAGATRGAEARLTLRRMPGDVAETTLAIFAGNGRADWSRAKPLALYQVPSMAGPEPELHAVLDAPGRVSVTEPPGVVSHPGTWAEVFRRIPARVATTAAPVDLVCAVDLSGTIDVVRQRKTLVRKLVELLDGEYPGARRLRVAVVTCTDHVFGDRGSEYRKVTDSSELGTAAQALDWLAATKGADIKDARCAPVEDLLQDAHDLLAGSARAGRRTRLVTLADRQPHPYPQGTDGRILCPLYIDWKQVVGKLDRLSARYAVVVDALPPPRSPDRASWTRLGPAGQLPLATASARQVAEALGLLADKTEHIPLPLTDDREGAST